jgi:hypothetical protein
MLLRIRRGELSDDELVDLFRECGAHVERVLGSEAMLVVKKYFVNSYGEIRTTIRHIKKQIAEFRRKSKEAYRV